MYLVPIQPFSKAFFIDCTALRDDSHEKGGRGTQTSCGCYPLSGNVPRKGEGGKVINSILCTIRLHGKRVCSGVIRIGETAAYHRLVPPFPISPFPFPISPFPFPISHFPFPFPLRSNQGQVFNLNRKAY